MADLQFRLTVKDDGSAAVEGFAEGVKRTGGVARRAAGRISRAFRGVTTRINALPGSIFNIRNALIGLGAGAVLKSIISAGSAVETARVRLIGLKGGVDAANEAFDFFQEVASGVAFSLEDVVEAGVSVEAFGAKSEEVLESVTDLAAFMGTSLPEAASAFGRAFAGGAGAADVLRERGILPLVKSFAGIEDLSKLTLPEFREALTGALKDPAGPIADSAKLLAETVTGQLSFIGDAIFKLRLRLFEGAIGEIFKELALNITIALNAIVTVLDEVDFGDIAGGFKDLIPSAKTIVGLFFQAGRVILGLQFAFQKAREFALRASVAMLTAFGKVSDFFFDLRSTIATIFDFLLRKVGDVLTAILDKVALSLFRIGQTVAKLPLERAQSFAQSLFSASDAAIVAAESVDKMGESSDRVAEIQKEQAATQQLVTIGLKDLTSALDEAKNKTEETILAFSKLTDAEIVAFDAVEKGIQAAKDQAKALDELKKRKEEAAKATRDQTVAEQESIFSLSTSLDAFQRGFTERNLVGLAGFLAGEQERVNSIEDSAKKAIEQRNLEQKSTLAITGGTLAGVAQLTEAFGGQNLALRKAFGVAEAAVNTAIGITNALSAGPAGIPLAAVIAALGAAQIAAILAAKPGGAAAPTVAGGGGGGAAPPPTEGMPGGPTAPVQAAAEGGPGGNVINITVSGIAGDEAEFGARLLEIIREEVGDGVQLTPSS